MATAHLLYYETHQASAHTEWLLLVHGAGGSTRTWKRQVQQLGAQYNLLIIDLPGHGQNSGRTLDIGTYSFEAIANKIWDVVDHLKINTLHLVGISLGTVLCLQMRILQPQRGNHKQSRDVFIKESKALTIAEFKNWTNLYYHLNDALNVFFQATTTIPHILIMGSQDHLFLQPATAYCETHKQARLSIIPDCGHVVSIEQAAQFNEVCLSFLKTIRPVPS